MQIMFINPNHLWKLKKDHYISKGQLNLRKINPPLGIAYLASILRDQHSVQIIEANALNLSKEQVISKCFEFKPDIIGITAFYTTEESSIELAKELRKNGYKNKIIVGGAGPTAEPEKYAKYFDIVILGEGEETIVDIIKNKKLESIKGISFLKNKKIIHNIRREQIKDLDSIPRPAWNLLPIEKYKPETMCIKYTMPSAMIMTSRGCPYNCDFCATNLMFKKLTFFSLNRVIQDIKKLYYKYNVQSITFADSTFTANRKRVMEFCDLLLEKNLKIKWNIETRADKVDYELLKRMKTAGCYYINFGVQTFNEEALNKVNRKLYYNKVKEAVEVSKKLGIITRLEFILGLPDENIFSMRKLFVQVNKLNPDFVSYYPLLILPKTKLALRNYKSPYSQDKLIKLAEEGYKKFYLRPKYLFSRLKHLWHPLYIKRYFDCFRNF